MQVERLAEADESEVVREVQEYYADYLAINSDLFNLNLTSPKSSVYGDSSASWDANAFQRSLDGIVGVLLSLKKRPLIRYEKNSPMCKRLAQEIHVRMLDAGAMIKALNGICVFSI